MDDHPLLSIAICTHDRAEDVERACRSCLEFQHGNTSFELLIIDNQNADQNNPNTLTTKIIKKLQASYPQLRYVHEPEIGLSHARNRAWKEAKGLYIGYLDDDALADPHWLVEAEKIITQYQPEVFGGPYYPFYVSEKPAWFKEAYGTNEPFSTDGPQLEINVYNAFTGGNLFIRRDLFQKHGAFSPTLGMRGQQIGLGEETEWQLRIQSRNPDTRFYYSSKLKIKHLVSEQKLSLWYHFRRAWNSGRQHMEMVQQVQIQEARRYPVLFRLPATAVRIFMHTVFGLSFRSRERFPYWRQYAFEVIRPYVKEFSMFLSELKPAVPISQAKAPEKERLLR